MSQHQQGVADEELEAARGAEVVALQRLRDAVLSVGVSSAKSTGLYTACSMYSKAMARRIIAERSDA